MNKETLINELRNELLDAIIYFERKSIFDNGFEIDKKIKKEILSYFDQLKEFESKVISEKIDEKYGWLLNFYRERKRNSNINTIRKISIYFLVISILSIIVGIITWIVLSQN